MKPQHSFDYIFSEGKENILDIFKAAIKQTPSLLKNKQLQKRIINEIFGFSRLSNNFKLVVKNNLEFSIENLFLIKFDKNLNRQIKEVDKNFFVSFRNYKNPNKYPYSNNRYIFFIFDYGLDLKYPNINFLNLSNEEVKELLKPPLENNFFIIKNGTRYIENIELKTFIKKLLRYTNSNVLNGTKNRFVPLIYRHGIDLIFQDINFLELSNEEVKEFFFSKLPNQTCIYCSNTFKDIKERKFCHSKKCLSTNRSERMKRENNPRAKFPDSFGKQYKENLSKITKKNILDGKFTPCVTNAWAKSRVVVENIPFRSTWEAYFYLFKTFLEKESLEFEKLRIKYFNSQENKYRIYIVDFIDYKNKVIYEIKPNSEKENIEVCEKETALKEWCVENDFKYLMITNEWFIENYTEILLGKITNEETRKKLRRTLNQFNKGL